MLSLGFFNAYLLWALPLAAVPIIIHLLNRRRYQKVDWAAMEYLLRAMKRNRRRMQMEHWLVLLLRTLAVVFLIFLVTRPQLTGGGGILRGITHHVVCLDDSASMAQRVGPTNVFQQAKERINKLTKKLTDNASGDLFTLIRSSTSGAQPVLHGQIIGSDLSQIVRGKLEDPVGDAVMNPGDLLASARRWADEKKKDAGDYHYYMVTDSRESDYVLDGKPMPGVLKHLEEMDPTHQQMTLMLVGPNETNNLGVTAVRRRDRLAMAKATVTLEVEVTNFGDEDSEASEVAITIDETSNVVRELEVIPAGGKLVVDIQHTFRDPGFHAVVATLKKDRYPLDDRGTLALEVVATSPVLVVDGDPGNSVEDGESFFLSAALDPGGDVLSGITVEAINEMSLAEYDLSHINMIFLCNIATPSKPVIEKLEAFVARGGGLMMFLGNQVNEKQFNAELYKGGKGLLPLPLLELKGNVDRPDYAFVADTEHFAIRDNAPLLDLILSKMVLIKRYYSMIEDPEAPVTIPVRVKGATGSPLLVSKVFKQGGHSVVFTSTADLAWSDFCQSPAFLPMMQEIHKYTTRVHEIAPYNLLADGTFEIEIDPAEYRRDVLVRSAGAGGFEATISAVDGEASENGAVTSKLTLPMNTVTGLGLFQVTMSPRRGDPEVRLLSRSVPPTEGRMQRLTKEGWLKSYSDKYKDRLEILEDTAGSGTGSQTGEGEIWRMLGLVLLAVLLIETLLAWRFGRR